MTLPLSHHRPHNIQDSQGPIWRSLSSVTCQSRTYMGYGALTDEQTGPAMERNKFLGKNLSTTCRLGKNTKAVKTKAPHRVAKGHKKRKNMHDMAPRKCVQTIDCGSNAQSLLHTLYRRHVHFANGWKTVQWPFFLPHHFVFGAVTGQDQRHSGKSKSRKTIYKYDTYVTCI